jgi:hypothetical protein
MEGKRREGEIVAPQAQQRDADDGRDRRREDRGSG